MKNDTVVNQVDFQKNTGIQFCG